MGKGYRQGRLGEEIRKIISDMLLRELKDPGLAAGMVSVTTVEVTSDGSYATVYLSSFDVGSKKGEDEEKKQKLLDAMYRCKGVIKREIGKQVKLRHIPDLVFKIDNSMEYGEHMDELLSSLAKKEEDE